MLNQCSRCVVAMGTTTGDPKLTVWWGKSNPNLGVWRPKTPLFSAQIMASNSQQPKGRAGKTVKPREPTPSSPSSSSDDDSDKDSKQSKSDAAPEPLTQTQSKDQFHAAPPTREDTEEYDPDKVSIKDVQQYTSTELSLVPVGYLRWDSKQTWGQIRKLDLDLVEKYRKSIDKEPPRLPVRVLLRNMGSGMFSFLHRIVVTFFFFHRHRVCCAWGPAHLKGNPEQARFHGAHPRLQGGRHPRGAEVCACRGFEGRHPLPHRKAGGWAAPTSTD